MDGRSDPRRRTTLKDVATKAGVSIMSASLAIRESDGSRRLSSETRRRILEAARDLDYRPDARAIALRRQQTDIVGFYAGYGFIDVRIPFFAEIIGGLQQGCEVFGKNLLLHSSSRDALSDEVFRELVDGRVDGLVVSMSASDSLAERLAATHLPVVAIADALPGIPSVVVDDEGGARMIAEHLATLGHHRAVFATGPALPTSGKRRQQGFIEAALAAGMEVTVRSLGDDPDLPVFVSRAKNDGATAIVAWNDVDARRILKTCQEAGMRLPKDMAIVGFDGCPTPYQDPFPLTTVYAPWAEVAQQAAIVLDRMLRNDAFAIETLLPVRFVRGATT